MKKAGVMIDDWKLPVFEKVLDKAGYKYHVVPGLTGDTLTLEVEYEMAADLAPYVEKANKLAAKNKRRLKNERKHSNN